MKKRILYITALAAIIAPIFLTGTINPFICIYIHLFGIILFAFGADRQLKLPFVLLFLWFDIFFFFLPDMPPSQNRFLKAGAVLSEDQKKKIRIECDTELLLNTNRYNWGKRTEVDEASNGPVVYTVSIYGYLPDFYKKLEKHVTLIK